GLARGGETAGMAAARAQRGERFGALYLNRLSAIGGRAVTQLALVVLSPAPDLGSDQSAGVLASHGNHREGEVSRDWCRLLVIGSTAIAQLTHLVGSPAVGLAAGQSARMRGTHPDARESAHSIHGGESLAASPPADRAASLGNSTAEGDSSRQCAPRKIGSRGDRWRGRGSSNRDLDRCHLALAQRLHLCRTSA